LNLPGEHVTPPLVKVNTHTDAPIAAVVAPAEQSVHTVKTELHIYRELFVRRVQRTQINVTGALAPPTGGAGGNAKLPWRACNARRNVGGADDSRYAADRTRVARRRGRVVRVRSRSASNTRGAAIAVVRKVAH
jgi:hypothetical protein